MKKILALAAVAVTLSTSIFAFGLVGAGAKFGVNFGAGTKLAKDTEDYAKNVSSSDQGGNVGGGFGFYALMDLYKLDFGTIFLQPELNFNFNNGYNIEVKDYKYQAKIYTHTLDIPVLVTLEAPIGKMFEVGGGLGFDLSFPLKSDMEYSSASTSRKASSDVDKIQGKPNFGMIFDANGKVLFGSGKKKNIAAVLDMRYTLDFTKTKFDSKIDNITITEEVFTRRFFSIWAGAEYRF